MNLIKKVTGDFNGDYCRCCKGHIPDVGGEVFEFENTNELMCQRCVDETSLDCEECHNRIDIKSMATEDYCVDCYDRVEECMEIMDAPISKKPKELPSLTSRDVTFLVKKQVWDLLGRYVHTSNKSDILDAFQLNFVRELIDLEKTINLYDNPVTLNEIKLYIKGVTKKSIIDLIDYIESYFSFCYPTSQSIYVRDDSDYQEIRVTVEDKGTDIDYFVKYNVLKSSNGESEIKVVGIKIKEDIRTGFKMLKKELLGRENGLNCLEMINKRRNYFEGKNIAHYSIHLKENEYIFTQLEVKYTNKKWTKVGVYLTFLYATPDDYADRYNGYEDYSNSWYTNRIAKVLIDEKVLENMKSEDDIKKILENSAKDCEAETKKSNEILKESTVEEILKRHITLN